MGLPRLACFAFGPAGCSNRTAWHGLGGLFRRSMASAEMEETLKRVSGYPGVQGVIVINADGIPIRTTLDQKTSVLYAAMVSQLTAKARAVLKELPLPGSTIDSAANELQVLRLRTQHHEIMVAPDGAFTLIVLQAEAQPKTTL